MNALNTYLEEELLEEVRESLGGSFVIDNDEKANWALKKIAYMENKAAHKVEECARWIEHYMAQVEKIKARNEQETSNLKNRLYDYFQTVEPDKDLKTKSEYSLPDGVLRMVKPSVDYERDEKTLVQWAKENAPEYVKIKESPDWAGIKKNIAIQGDCVVYSPTGEIIEGVNAVEKPGKFEVKAG